MAGSVSSSQELCLPIVAPPARKGGVVGGLNCRYGTGANLVSTGGSKLFRGLHRALAFIEWPDVAHRDSEEVLAGGHGYKAASALSSSGALLEKEW